MYRLINPTCHSHNGHSGRPDLHRPLWLAASLAIVAFAAAGAAEPAAPVTPAAQKAPTVQAVASPDKAHAVPGVGQIPHSTIKPAHPGSAKPGAKKKLRGTPPCLAWIDPEVQPRAVLLCVHGLGLHNGSYEQFGKRMTKLGVASYAVDMRGFGSWMEAKGREKVDFTACLEDVRAVLKVIHRAHPGLPVFLLGESMGGAIALQSTALYPDLIDGTISSVPSGDRFEQGKTSIKVALRLLAKPNTEFDVGTGVIEQATQKPELRESWSKDPLSRMNISPKELLQFQMFMNKNHEAAKNITRTPVLIVQGCQDKLVRPEGTVELYNELGCSDRQLVLVPGAEHLIFEENQFNDEVVELVSKWIDARLVKPVGTPNRAASAPAVDTKAAIDTKPAVAPRPAVDSKPAEPNAATDTKPAVEPAPAVAPGN